MVSSVTTTMKWQEQNLERFSLFWLQSVAFIPPDVEQQLRSLINRIQIFDKIEECELSIRRSTAEEIILVVNEELAKDIVPRIHDLAQQSSIYIYGIEEKSDNWISHYPKVKCIVNQLDKIISQIKLAERQGRFKGEGSIPNTICDIQLESDIGERSSRGVNGAFIHSHLFIETLLGMHTDRDDHFGQNLDDFIKMCSLQYQDNQSYLKLIAEFQQQYTPEKAVWWYTRDSFVYRLLNQALRVENINLLLLFQFFIRDLHKQLIQLHTSTTMNDITTSYRAQLMSKEEIDVFRRSLGNIISMKSFQSTTLSKEYAMMQLYPQKPSDDHNIEQVLFEITFQKENFPSFPGTPFADISKESNFPQEEEVLFSIGSIFRIANVQKEGRQFWKIYLVYLESSESPLYKEDGNHVNRIYKLMEDQLPFDSTRMGAILHLSGRLNEAESYCRQQIDYWSRIDPKVLERQLEDDKLFKCLSKIVDIDIKEQNVRDIKGNLQYYYLKLALVLRDKGDDDGCLFWSEYLRNFNPHFSTSQLYLCYYHIITGEVCEHSGQLAEAYRKYEKALYISVTLSKRQEYKIPTHDIILNIANISLKFCPQKHKPLELYEKVLENYRTSTPFSHPRIAFVKLNIADYYRNISQFKLALEEYEDCLQIFVRSLPLDHVNIGLAYYGIGLCYQLINHQNDIVQAISYLERAETIFKKHLISDHWRLIRTEQTLRRLKNKFKPNLYPSSLYQWNENDVKRFLVEKQLDCLVTLYGKMNGRALLNFYRISTGNSNMLQEINADLATVDTNKQKDQITTDKYNRFLNELKLYLPDALKSNSTMTTSAVCGIM